MMKANSREWGSSNSRYNMPIFFNLRNWYFLPYPVNKDVTVISSTATMSSELLGEPWGNLGRKIAIWLPSDCSHSPQWALRKLRRWKHRILAPESWGTYQRNNFSGPDSSSHTLKMLNSLTWDIWSSSSFTIIFWCSDYLPFVSKPHILTPSHLSE